MTKLDAARDAFIEETVSRGWEFPAVVRKEAYDEAVALEAAARKLTLAIEEYKATINGLDHVGKIVSPSAELANLIVDYECGEVGGDASRILARACDEAGEAA